MVSIKKIKLMYQSKGAIFIIKKILSKLNVLSLSTLLLGRKGFNSEINFWDGVLSQKETIDRREKANNKYISNMLNLNRIKYFPKPIRKYLLKNKVHSVLEIGSGPVSTLAGGGRSGFS
jgi:hypothetical protein